MSKKITKGEVVGAMLLLLSVGLVPHVAAASGTVASAQSAKDTVSRNATPITTTASAPNVTSVAISGQQFASVNGTPYVWRSSVRRFDADFAFEESGVYALCLSTDSDANRTAATCERFAVNATDSSNVTVVGTNATVVSVAPNGSLSGDATGWSKAKVSRRLSAMADDDELTKVQIGRENLICPEEAVPDPAMPRDVPPSGKPGGLTATPASQ